MTDALDERKSEMIVSMVNETIEIFKEEIFLSLKEELPLLVGTQAKTSKRDYVYIQSTAAFQSEPCRYYFFGICTDKYCCYSHKGKNLEAQVESICDKYFDTILMAVMCKVQDKLTQQVNDSIDIIDVPNEDEHVFTNDDNDMQVQVIEHTETILVDPEAIIICELCPELSETKSANLQVGLLTTSQEISLARKIFFEFYQDVKSAKDAVIIFSNDGFVLLYGLFIIYGTVIFIYDPGGNAMVS